MNNNSTADGAAGRHSAKSVLKSFLQSMQTGVVLSILSALFLIVFFWQSVLVFNHPGQQGVYWSRFFGGTSDMILGEGAHLKLPWDEIYQYDIRLAAIHEHTVLLGKDGMEMDINWSVRYRPKIQELPLLHRTIGPDYAEKVIVPEVVSSLREILGNYTAEELYAYDEEELLYKLELQIQKHFETYPVFIKNLLILKLQLPEDMKQGIVQKLLHKQNMLSYEFRQKAQELEVKRLKTEAEGLKLFEETSNVSILKWKGIQATVDLSKSPNAKIVVIGTDTQSLPLLLNTDK